MRLPCRFDLLLRPKQREYGMGYEPLQLVGYEPLQPFIDTGWLAAHGIGAEPIDDDHERLFQTLKRMRKAYAAGQDMLCLSLINVFDGMIRAHFAHEEAMFAQLVYPGAGRHIAQHKVLAVRVQTITQAAARTPLPPHALADLIDGLAVVAITDHLALDLELKQYLP
jgi:hemerythrin-like metal-binding protein